MINGSYFGETEIICHRKRDFYVQCEQPSEFFFLDRSFMEGKIRIEFPAIYYRLKLIAEEREKRNLQALEYVSR